MAGRHSLGTCVQTRKMTRLAWQWMMSRATKYKDLQKAIGYRFADQDLLELALTHASVRSANATREDNERLEFIGDRVLGLTIAEHVMKAYPDEKEGDLARRFNRLVRRETCARVGHDIDLGRDLVLSPSEDESGGRKKDTILANAVEALLGAVFLEAGYDKAKAVVMRLWHDYLGDAPKAAIDAKTALQEWAQASGLPLPEYVEILREGPDHAPVFTSEVRLSGRKAGRGEGSSKRSAEQDAARRFLRREGVWGKTADGG